MCLYVQDDSDVMEHKQWYSPTVVLNAHTHSLFQDICAQLHLIQLPHTSGSFVINRIICRVWLLILHHKAHFELIFFLYIHNTQGVCNFTGNMVLLCALKEEGWVEESVHTSVYTVLKVWCTTIPWVAFYFNSSGTIRSWVNGVFVMTKQLYSTAAPRYSPVVQLEQVLCVRWLLVWIFFLNDQTGVKCISSARTSITKQSSENFSNKII